MGGHEGILVNLGGAKSNHPKIFSLKKTFLFFSYIDGLYRNGKEMANPKFHSLMTKEIMW
jgi:hypothetical protein